jgi:hypothetical protein
LSHPDLFHLSLCLSPPPSRCSPSSPLSPVYLYLCSLFVYCQFVLFMKPTSVCSPAPVCLPGWINAISIYVLLGCGVSTSNTMIKNNNSWICTYYPQQPQCMSYKQYSHAFLEITYNLPYNKLYIFHLDT